MFIQLEPNLSKETLINLHLHYKKEREDKERTIHNNPMWNEAREMVEHMRGEILNQEKRRITHGN